MSPRMSGQERRKNILMKALSIIFEEGFHALTIRKIADSCGITEAALYRHFENKEDLINSLTRPLFDQKMLPESTDEEKDPYQELYGFMYRQFSHLEKNPQLTAILFQEEIFRQYPDIRVKFNQHRQKREEKIMKLILSGQKQGIIDRGVKPRIFALLYMGSIRISVLRWRNEGFSYSLAEEADHITEELFKLLKEN